MSYFSVLAGGAETHQKNDDCTSPTVAVVHWKVCDIGKIATDIFTLQHTYHAPSAVSSVPIA
mgnify:CR=1 FL=1